MKPFKISRQVLIQASLYIIDENDNLINEKKKKKKKKVAKIFLPFLSYSRIAFDALRCISLFFLQENLHL